ncbi:hypothetical protein [Mesorhizobium sp. M7A.F.Ca.US.006.01.1.1]|uniref:hypothetical protein n=1 Tax=Mesorhizobium sp. M7A.F.Ca.US.006.01.1.1 TaxID=2496707 RepID=UPI0013E374C6|nr:hypothetical protein [Mesorhizobium sp. M7A.F.Ca.US.006.01.1.1]
MDEPKKPVIGPEAAFVERLVKEAGITEDQARELIVFLGLNWASLVREAKLLRKSARP